MKNQVKFERERVVLIEKKCEYLNKIISDQQKVISSMTNNPGRHLEIPFSEQIQDIKSNQSFREGTRYDRSLISHHNNTNLLFSQQDFD